MLASFLLSFREGLEAALIIGVLLGALHKLGRSSDRKSVWLGAATALILSMAAGVVINRLGASFEGRGEQIFEGSTMLLAAVILTWVILWMQSQAHSVNQKLESDVSKAVYSGNRMALFSLAFLSVFREGIELALFLTAASMNSENLQVLVGAGAGLLAVILFAILLFKSLVRLDVKKFFRFTSLILIFFAAGLVAHGVHELNEAGLIPPIIENVWNINSFLDENSTLGQFLKTLVGYNGNPSLTEAFSYFLYLVLVWFLGKRLTRKVS
jgi:high-affinity iron transporter